MYWHIPCRHPEKADIRVRGQGKAHPFLFKGVYAMKS